MVFRLHPFPGKKRNPEARKKWCQLINRTKKNGISLWSPGIKSRVCSEHFEDGESLPTLKLGYDCSEKVKKLKPPSKRRKLEYNLKTSNDCQTSNISSVHVDTSVPATESDHVPDATVVTVSPTTSDPDTANTSQTDDIRKEIENLQTEKNLLIRALLDAKQKLQNQSNRVKILRGIVIRQKSDLKKTVFEKLIKSDKDISFYCGLPNIKCFEELLKLLKPFIKKKWHGKNSTKPLKKKVKMGRKTVLSPREELFLTLVKLRLGLTVQDLADRFGVSTSTVSSTFKTWIKILSTILKCVIFTPDQGSLNFTRPKRFDHVKDVAQIIDCFEVFIETPKSLELQKLTWSEYKHHNTVKYLVGCTPNSSVSFMSDGYPGSISDKKIVNHSKFLETVEQFSYIMADKGFNIEQECTVHRIGLYVPPGKRGAHQMLPCEIVKTKRVANLRILIEQVIRQIRSFKILTQEIPVTLLPCLDHIVTVCAGFVNFKKPIYKD